MQHSICLINNAFWALESGNAPLATNTEACTLKRVKPIMATPQGSNDEPPNQRIVRAFRSHYETLVKAIDPDGTALALYSNELITPIVFDEATNSKDTEFARSLCVLRAVERYLNSCKSSSDALKILSVVDKHIPPTSDGGVIARIRRESMCFGGE